MDNHLTPQQIKALQRIGIVNIPLFFKTSKSTLTNVIATLALLDNSTILGEDDKQTVINFLRDLQCYIEIISK